MGNWRGVITGPIKITFVTASLTSGGSEKVLVSLAAEFVKRGHTVSIITLNGKEMDFHQVPEGVLRLSLGVTTLGQSLLKVLVFRRMIQSTTPDVVISFIDRVNMMTLLATRRLKIPVIVSERVDPKLHPLGKKWEVLRQWTYPFSDSIVVQTSRALNYFSPRFHSKICIIPNPVFPPITYEKMLDKPSKLSVIGVGRFYYQKGFDLLIMAFARLKDRCPQWTLTILGDGPLRDELQSLCNKLGVRERVFFPGRVEHPDHFLKQADLFVLSSRFEGFPNALCEAMACGLPVIASDCPSGPREIIRQGKDGVLVPNQDVEALSEAMGRLMSDEAERNRLAASAVEVTERFSIEKIIEKWEGLLFKVLDERKSNESP